MQQQVAREQQMNIVQVGQNVVASSFLPVAALKVVLSRPRHETMRAAVSVLDIKLSRAFVFDMSVVMYYY